MLQFSYFTIFNQSKIEITAWSFMNFIFYYKFKLIIMNEVDEVVDIDEARIMLSIKNDQINSIKKSMKTLEKRTSIKVIDLQNRIQNQKGKVLEGEKKIQKLQQAFNKERTLFNEKEAANLAQIFKLKQINAELQTFERKKQRQLKGAIYQQKMKTEREREINLKLHSELDSILQVFDPKKIMLSLKKTSLQQIPNYLHLYSELIQKSEQLKQQSLMFDRLRSDTILGMEQSFKKLTSYEAVMQDLKNRNELLVQNIQQKELQLQAHSAVIDEKKQLIEKVKMESDQQLTHLSQQIINLRTYVKTYEQQQQQLQNIQKEHMNNIRTIEQLEIVLENKQNQLQELTLLSQDKIQRLIEQNHHIKRQGEQILQIHREQIQYSKNIIYRLQKTIIQKQELINLMNNSLKEQQMYSEQKKVELQRYIWEFNELLKKKHREQEEYKQNQQYYKEQLITLAQEVQFLRNKINQPHRENSLQQFNQLSAERSQHSFNGSQFRQLKRAKSGMESLINVSPRNLLIDIRDNSQIDDKISRADIGNYQNEPNWSQKYYLILQKHNNFMKKVYSKVIKLKKCI